MKVKIGKITFDGYNNYGNTLQSFALQEYLRMQGYEVDSLWHSPHERLSEYWKWGLKEDIKFLTNYGRFRTEIKSGVRAWEFARRTRGMDFTQRYINVRYDFDNFRDIEAEYDFFIVGSDQVWNPRNQDLSTAFLEFAEPRKRVSFAASIGAQHIPGNIQERYRSGLVGMKAISVREEKAAEIIYEMTGRKVEILLDPVFCVDAKRWRDISVRPYWLKDKDYLFAYFLGETPSYVSRLANSNGLEVVKCFDEENIDRYIMSPEEWLYLISNAKYVCTDSFHATAFSIIFDKSFLVSARAGNEENKQMVTRIESVLKTFGLESCFYTPQKEFNISKDNTTSNGETIKCELERTARFLQDALCN